MARMVHEQSSRTNASMIKVNCAAIPKDLFESEFFGHEKGSFTGATAKRVGRFELANGGTLFLDEIGELPLDIQAKLLRVIQEREFERVGGQSTQKVDIRLIAATNRDLLEEVNNRRFREDLYYRLNVFPVRIPPLRERQEDIPMLVSHMLTKFSKKHSRPAEEIHPESLQTLMAYGWPGNIRELENVIERAVIVNKDQTLTIGDWLGKQLASPTNEHPTYPEPDSDSFPSLEESERTHILRALEMTKWRVSGDNGAAQLLGINRSTLRSRMEKLGISRDNQLSSE